jgi:hypothetical protein
MKLHRTHLFVPSLLLLFAALPLAQERVTKKGPPEFKDVHAEVARAYEAGKLGLAVSKSKELLGVLQTKWGEAILAALPAAPEGFELVPQKKQDPQAAGMLAAMAGAVGTVVEQKYKGDGVTITATVQADSPLIQMFSMWVANPSMLGEGAELVKYGDVNAVLKKEGRGWSLQILIGTSLVDAKGAKDDAMLLRMFDQAVVDELSRVLAI